jgi:hypothetical protein|tara:strand:+ start:2418 stop:2876 length:459 start_codon:yes stop_codon:yes gene_type:complete
MKNKIDKPLTDMQRNFANLYVENLGANKLTNTQLAINSGYAPESAYQRATELLNPRICPHVVKYISERKAEFLQKNNIDPNKHMAALQYAKDRADKMDMIGVYLRAEELRGKVAGYYIDKQIIAKKDLDDESEEQLENKMKKILDDNKEFTK